MSNAFTSGARPSIFASDNQFNGRGPSKVKRVNLAPQRGSSFTAPITTIKQADRTNSIKGRM